MKLYTSVEKGLKIKVRKFWELIPTFVEVTGEKLVGGELFDPSILNRIKREVKKRRPESCLCRLCKYYIHCVGFI